MKRNKEKGFTLIELLAVIVILAIIALITVPIILNVIYKAEKGAFEDAAYGVIDAGRLHFTESLADTSSFAGKTFDFGSKEHGLKISGEKPGGGTLVLDGEGNQTLAVYDTKKRWCALKGKEEHKVKIGDYKGSSCDEGVKPTPTPTPAPPVEGSDSITDKNKPGNTEGLITDDFGNIRYTGNNSAVKNYVTYNNQTWRIIGIFGGKIKIMKEDSIGDKAWNTTAGVSDWTKSTLMTYLNNTYYTSLSSTSQQMIETVLYNLGGSGYTGKSKRNYYQAEKGTAVYNGNATTWNGKVALVYASDYGYAAASVCTGDLNKYYHPDCKNNNWMLKTQYVYEWTLTHAADSSNRVNHIYADGGLDAGMPVSFVNAVRPALYLKSTVKLTGGNGTIGSPYTLSI